ncbi:single-stranded DNA-binding protein [Nitrolancea hollandica]|uniref:Uncharacterized protein n=1 Tax=Nitrolancea hollandica Lb TaxID=1129897 RepID=I4ELB9_9BACT|nr:single-stranded DNA-binding protein [Nitrolancea hollandica]CCF85481.1 hypothetical protein NITHO_500016 [Nitrolancea hollandica Lb]
MTEHSPIPQPEQQPDGFVPDTVSDALRSHPEPVEDVYGDGLRWRFGLGERTTLDIFPDTNIARIAFPDAQLLFRAGPPRIEQGEVIFESLRENTITRVVVTPESGVVIALAAFGAKGHESSSPPLQESSDSLIAEGQETPLLTDSVPSETTSSAPVETERQRIQIRDGIVGREPKYYETAKGTPVARFSVGQKQDDGRITWHTTIAFKNWAGYVRDNLHKRDHVDLYGYPHERTKQDGTTVTELFVGFLKKREPDKPEKPS